MSVNKKLNPWNWFQHEEPDFSRGSRISVDKQENNQNYPTFLSGPQPMLHQYIDRVFDEFFRGSLFPSSLPLNKSKGLINDAMFTPNVNISVDDQNYLVTLDIPGLDESDVSIDVKGDKLHIQGKKETEIESNDRHFYRVERSSGEFHRVLYLPEDANVDDTQATMKDGVLSLTIPRQESIDTQTKRIAVNN